LYCHWWWSTQSLSPSFPSHVASLKILVANVMEVWTMKTLQCPFFLALQVFWYRRVRKKGSDATNSWVEVFIDDVNFPPLPTLTYSCNKFHLSICTASRTNQGWPLARGPRCGYIWQWYDRDLGFVAKLSNKDFLLPCWSEAYDASRWGS
jgi:hypothetical protein